MLGKKSIFILIVIFNYVYVYCEDSESEVIIKIATPPPNSCARKTKEGDLVTIHYIAWLKDGSEIGNTYIYDEPLSFHLGSARVPKGLTTGITDMCEGEIRELDIPPHLGYGEEEKDDIPAGSWLYYEVEMLTIRETEETKDLFDILDKNEDQQLDHEEVRAYFEREDIMKSIGIDPDDQNVKEFLTNALFNIGDKDEDGVLNRTEFMSMEHFEQYNKTQQPAFREDL